MFNTLMKTSHAVPFCSTEIHPPARMVFPQHRSSMADLSRTCSQITANHSEMSGSKVLRRLKRQAHTAGRKTPSIMPMHISSLRSELDLMLLSKT